MKERFYIKYQFFIQKKYISKDISNHQVYTANLNGISLYTSQIDRFNLNQKGLTELNKSSNSNLNRLKKADFQTKSTEQLYGYKTSQDRDIHIILGQRIQFLQQENNKINQNKILMAKHLIRPKRENCQYKL